MTQLSINCTVQQPRCGSGVFIATNATIFGDVTIGDDSTILFGTIIRGDTASVIIGRRSNVQDLCCIHADPGFPTRIGDDVTLGHGAIVHGATVEDEVLIGIRAVVLNGAKIGRNSIIGACSLVPEGKVIPPRSLVMGIPGRIVREVTDEDLHRIRHAAANYVATNQAYRSSGVANCSTPS